MVRQPFRQRVGCSTAAVVLAGLVLATGLGWFQADPAHAQLFTCDISTALGVAAGGGVTPGGGNVVVTRASVIAATWRLPRDPSAGGAAQACVSGFGLFTTQRGVTSPSDPRVIGQVNFPLTAVTPRPGLFSVPETLLIPAETSLKALRLGLQQFFYTRQFSPIPAGAGATTAAEITCRLSTSAFGIFSIGRMEIYFAAGRNDILVRRGTQGLKAYADILFNGTGTLRARWLVAEPGARIPAPDQVTAKQTFVPGNIFRPDDWRILSYVEKTVTFGDRIVLQSPDLPGLPTFVTGQHLVRLEILQDRATDAQVGIQLPVARYFVEGDRVGIQAARAGTPVRLSAPADGAQLAQAPPPTFSWFAVPGTAQYRVEIYEADPRAGAFGGISGDPSVELYRSGGGAMRAITLMDAVGQKVFSAVTQGAVTSLPLHPGYVGRFRPRQVYLWKVVAVDGRGDPIGASPLRTLSFQAQ